MNKILVFLFLIVFSTLSFSQNQKSTISGKIVDQKTGETLIGVNISIKNKSLGTITNNYGFYSITIPNDTYTISYSYLGYKTIEKEIKLTNSLQLDIKLAEEENVLDEVIISQSKNNSGNNIRKPQMSTTVLKAKTIKETPTVLGESDLVKTITLLPGVTDVGEGSAGFNVRGGSTDQNLVLLDEATIYNTSHLLGFLSVFNTDVIKDIKLYKGGIPSKYGGRLSSVLEVHQKDGNYNNTKFTGGIGLLSSRLMVEGPIRKEVGSFLVAGRTSYLNLFLSLADEPNRISFYDLNTKLSYRIDDNNKIYFSGYFGKDKIKLSDSFKNSYGNFFINTRLNHIFNNKLFSNLSLIYSEYDYNLEFVSEGFEWASSINNINLKYNFNYYLNNTLKINFGTDVFNYHFNPGEIIANSNSSPINEEKLDDKIAFEPSIYLEAEHKLSDKFTARYGFRFSSFFRLGNKPLNTYTNDLPVVFNEELNSYESAKPIGVQSESEAKKTTSFFNIEPRFSLVYQLNEQSSLKGSYQRMNQYIHLISNTNAPTPLDIWAPSGKYIKPQNSDLFALGLFKNFEENNYSIEVETYYKSIKNSVDFIDGAELIANNNIETEILQGDARAYGLEFLLRKNSGRFTGLVGYTISKSEQRVSGRSPNETGINNGIWYNTPQDRTHDLSITGNYSLTEKWSLNANFVFQTGRPTTYPNGQYQFEGLVVPVFTSRNEERLPAYHRLDISATYTPKHNKNKKWESEWVFGIYNIYNRQNANSIRFRQNETTLNNEAVQTSIFGIIPSITYNFKF
ncbi:TonB-dependent receptor [Polaribacter porphyrae]|uniref:isocitrate dehydrogenase (NADP(+)) n=1 Tax=Polaribacter porphyrae TaxID=1137780 RepID=A0A2S7WPR1_9FLAO|nr:TonB-dependent receptor [Polaribacter porphyrae]PQJ79271.1 hypothetical protein BTO18_08840 [Polaribacter porphyrae]